MNSDLLANLTDAEKHKFANLYDLSLDVFEKSDKAGKQIIIFLGTRDDQTKNLEDFISFFTNYYGNEDYALFYKGHQGDLTNNNSERAKILKKYGWQELDAQIPAELFYFFRPDCMLGGYPSTTYLNCSNAPLAFITISGLRQSIEDEVKDYIGRAEGYIETNSKGYHIIKKDGSSWYWNPEQPSILQ